MRLTHFFRRPEQTRLVRLGDMHKRTTHFTCECCCALTGLALPCCVILATITKCKANMAYTDIQRDNFAAEHRICTLRCFILRLHLGHTSRCSLGATLRQGCACAWRCSFQISLGSLTETTDTSSARFDAPMWNNFDSWSFRLRASEQSPFLLGHVRTAWLLAGKEK